MKNLWIFFYLLSLLFVNCSSNGHNGDVDYDVVVEEDVLATNIQLSDQSGEKIPIMAYFGVRTVEAPLNVIKDFADAGFTMNIDPGLRWHANAYKYTPKMLFDALDVAAENGFKNIVTVDFLDALSQADMTKLVNHPGLAGYFVYDEPTTYERVTELKSQVEKVLSKDGKNFPYVNLASADCRGTNWAPAMIGCTDIEPSPYASFVKNFADELNLPMISVDVYPVVFDAATNRRYIKPGWFYSLEVTSREAKARNREFWAFALSTQFSGNGLYFPPATKSDLRLQMFTNLAYGAQVLQYYTYSGDSGGGLSPITPDGVKTPIYYIVQNMNKEIAALSPVFLHAKVQWVAHTGEIPDGCTELDKLQLPNIFKSLEIKGGEGALVSLLEKDEDNFLVVLNRNVQGRSSISVKATGSDNLYRVNKQSQPVLLGNSAQIIEPGDMVIYFWKK